MIPLLLALTLSVRVEVRAVWPDSAAHVAAFHAHRVDGDAADVDASDSPLLLAPGQWFVSATAPGYWSEPQLVDLRNGPAEAVLAMEPSTRLKARLKMPRGEHEREVTIHLQTVESQRARYVTCPIVEDRIDCDVPSGQQDVVFRVKGYASLFRWNEALAAPGVDLGLLVFQRGSTFSGRVEMPPESKNEAVDVTLQPKSTTLDNDALRSRKTATLLVSHPNTRGYFAFNVTPGQYVVHATSHDLTSDDREVTVIEGRQAVLQEPLVLARRAALTIQVHPEVDPWQKPWHISVKELFGSERERSVVAPATGRATLPSLSPGSYAIHVHRSDIDSWATAYAAVKSDSSVDIHVDTVRVRGSVKIGEQPLAARVTFLDDRGLRLPVRTKADGTFVTLLPKIEKDTWPRVEVESTNPFVKRSLTSVTLSGTDSPEASVDLQLPATTVEGTVVDTDGVPLMEAVIDVQRPESEFEQIEMLDGHFRITGLAPGLYALSARSGHLQSEAPVDVDLSEGSSKQITLIIKEATRVRGVVRSSFGPVANAGVFYAPAGFVPPVVVVQPAGVDGTFDMQLPPQTQDAAVTVNSPGFAFRMLRLPVTANQAEVVVDQRAGTLVIENAGDKAMIGHGGATLPALLISYVAPVHRLSASSFELRQTEPGDYTLCQDGQCQSGSLADNGRLVLRLKDDATHAK